MTTYILRCHCKYKCVDEDIVKTVVKVTIA